MKKHISLSAALSLFLLPSMADTASAQLLGSGNRNSAAVGSGSIEGVISRAPSVGNAVSAPDMNFQFPGDLNQGRQVHGAQNGYGNRVLNGAQQLSPQSGMYQNQAVPHSHGVQQAPQNIFQHNKSQYQGQNYSHGQTYPQEAQSFVQGQPTPAYVDQGHNVTATPNNTWNVDQGGAVNYGGGEIVSGPMIEQGDVVGETYFQDTAVQQQIVGSRLSNRVANVGNPDVTRVWGLNGLSMRRDYDTNVLLSSNGAGGFLSTADANVNNFGGADLNLINRRCNGRGWEGRYFGLFSDDAIGVLPGNTPISQLRGLANLTTGIGVLATVIDTPGVHSVTRSNDIHNAEFNFLRRSSTPFFGKRFDLNETMMGFRYFRFNEDLIHRNQFNAPVGAGLYATQYDVNAENNLFGFQLGRRMEKSLRRGFGMTMSAKAGVFGNRSSTQQSWSTRDVLGNFYDFATVDNRADRDYDYGDNKTDLSFLGEFDAGLTYQFTRRSRARVGYRALGVTDLALADNQIPQDFVYPDVATNVNTDGDLFMHGGYFGIEFVR